MADKLLMTLRREREYVQLHRDTTVTQLTLSPSLEGGRVVWVDSPLVRALLHGRVLVVDEADKAPPEVVCVLKGLLEDGELLLGDGRRFVTARSPLWHGADTPDATAEGVRRVHTDFRVIALANRPGYPFLGADVYAELGDAFATHVCSNPDATSERALLRAYAPRVEERLLDRVVAAFSDLRDLADTGDVAYPYSTREAVAVAKHLEAHPAEGVAAALANVLAFEAFDPALLGTLREVFSRHGIEVGQPDAPEGGEAAALAPAVPMPGFGLVTQIFFAPRGEALEPPRTTPLRAAPPLASSAAPPLAWRGSRRRAFTEELASAALPELPGAGEPVALAAMPTALCVLYARTVLIAPLPLGVAAPSVLETWPLCGDVGKAMPPEILALPEAGVLVLRLGPADARVLAVMRLGAGAVPVGLALVSPQPASWAPGSLPMCLWRHCSHP